MEHKTIDFSHIADELQLGDSQQPLCALIVVLGKKQIYVWLGGASAKQGDIVASIPNPESTTTLLAGGGSAEHPRAQALSRRMAIKLNRMVFASLGSADCTDEQLIIYERELMREARILCGSC